MLDKDSLNSEISVGVTFASLMAAISLFFTGAIVAQYHSFEASIKVPLLFLIISTFSFIFAATIYNNAGAEVTLGKLKTVEKYMIYAKNIVEFLGLYPLILATPLVIGALTNDNFLRISTIVIALVGTGLYSQSKFSILEKQFSLTERRFYSAGIVLVSLLLYVAQAPKQFEAVSSYTFISVLLITGLLLPCIYFSLRSHQYRVILIRTYKDTDAEALEKLVQKNMQHAKRQKRSASLRKEFEVTYSQAAIRKQALKEQIFVATSGTRRVGFAILSENTILSIFTDPAMHRKGIGRMLVDAAELSAGNLGHEEMETHVFAPSDRFFKKIGYTSSQKLPDGRIILRKEL